MAETDHVVELIGAALRATGLRGKVIANNIANLQTPGYRRKEVRFEQLLARVLDSPGEADLQGIQGEIFEPRSTPVNSQGNDVSLDVEVGEMVKNGAIRKTYIRLLNKIYRQMELAITGQ